MSGYSFKFDKVLNYKEKIEDVKKLVYGQINQKLMTEEERLQSFNSYKSELLAKKKESTKKTSISNLKLYNRMLEDISLTIKNQEGLVSEIKTDLEIAKEELLIAMQEKKAFEKLKESSYEEYIVETKKQEEKIIDGIVSFNNSSKQ